MKQKFKLYKRVNILRLKNHTICVLKEKHTCAICLEYLTDGDMNNKLYCDHMFHNECLIKWLQYKTKCPLCMRNVFEKKKEEEFVV